MDQSWKAGNARAFVKNLGNQERLELLRELLATQTEVAPSGHHLQLSQLILAEHWLWQQATRRGIGAHNYAQGRLWLTFMLLRYGGLRLKEVFELTEADCHFHEGFLWTGGRLVPFPPKIASVLANFWLTWPGRNHGERPFQCDSSQIRRGLGRCARACAIGSGILSARSLRRQRGLELELGGLHPALIAFFLGSKENPQPFSNQVATAMITHYISKENEMKTSARNVFRGPITKLEPNGILVSVTLETTQGLEVTAIITQTSSKNLNLAKGVVVNALVKAPWVTALPVAQRASAGLDNCFQGTVEDVNRDPLACEIRVVLPQGNEICALYANGARPSQEIKEGATVLVGFSAFAVILTTD